MVVEDDAVSCKEMVVGVVQIGVFVVYVWGMLVDKGVVVREALKREVV